MAPLEKTPLVTPFAAAETPDRDAGSNAGSNAVCVVVNRSAGALIGGGDAIGEIRAAFHARGMHADFIALDAGNLPERIKLARDSGAGTIVVAGGDVTIACAAQVLADSDVSLGILPSGTMNLLARDLSFPIGDLDAAVHVIATGRPRYIDVGEVNGHVFLCASMLGLPTRLAVHREAARGGSEFALWGRFLRAAVRALSVARPMRLHLVAGSESRIARTVSLSISVNMLGAGSDRQFGRGCLDGGQLGVYTFRRLRFIDTLRIAVAAMFGRVHDDPAIEESSVPDLTVVSHRPALRVMNDGEMLLLSTPLRYRVRPRALKVIAAT